MQSDMSNRETICTRTQKLNETNFNAWDRKAIGSERRRFSDQRALVSGLRWWFLAKIRGSSSAVVAPRWIVVCRFAGRRVWTEIEWISVSQVRGILCAWDRARRLYVRLWNFLRNRMLSHWNFYLLMQRANLQIACHLLNKHYPSMSQEQPREHIKTQWFCACAKTKSQPGINKSCRDLRALISWPGKIWKHV